MNGAKVSRRSVYENEQKFCESGAAPHVGVVDEVVKSKIEKTSRSFAVEMKVFPIIDTGRDINKKLSISVEERKSSLINQDADFSPKNLLSPKSGTILSPTSPEYRPSNFGTVAPGIFRSGFPVPSDFPYLRSLRLKTILSLAKKDFSPEFKEFVEKNNITHKVIDMTGTKKVQISETMMKNIMSIVLDPSNYPILIHCNHGRHRTGCTVAVLRHVLGWDVKKIIHEYRDFASPKERSCDIEYIAEFELGMLGHLLMQPSKTRSKYLKANSKTWRMLFLSIVLMVVFTTLRCFKDFDIHPST